MSLSKETILDVLRPVVGEAQTYEHHNQLSVIVGRSEIVDVLRELRDNPLTKFEQLIDITAIDWLKNKQDRFEVVYFLYSISNKARVRIKIAVPEKDVHVPTVTDIYESANWYERETYDMYGIRFDGHPDLRRFYMPEDYVDPETKEPLYPLRKDYPLMGIPGAAIMPDFPEKEDWKRKKEAYLKEFPANPLDTSYSKN
ncbi:MAG: NADH-quinone oxidoreductase subunit C [Candidatus Kapabacteria bacterium]|nr:NADH-quinone oxidoreductase subunit C [Candidatus Kapabacteria bacterium]